MIKEIFGITRNANAKKEFCQTQYLVPRKLLTQSQKSENFLKNNNTSPTAFSMLQVTFKFSEDTAANAVSPRTTEEVVESGP